MKIGILGYGNLGRGVECAIKQNPDMELAAVFTRRAPETVSILTEGAAVCSVDDVEQWKDKIDVMILCGGSATDLPEQTPKYAKMFNVVDSFDTHARIPEHFENVDKSAKESGHVGIISVGWDPGMFSLNRMYANAILPEGRDYTFWGKGVSQGHSDAIRRVEGVKDGKQYTIPVEATKEPESKTTDTKGKHHAKIKVKNYGTIEVELDGDTAPITVDNFIKLVNDKFYDGLTFHRIISGFMIQGGDPLGNGTGGSDETIKGEFSSNGVENNISHKRGVISMARSSDPDSASSQFFIMHQDSTYLDGEYAAFGKVTKGMKVVDKICEDATPTDGNGTIEKADQPVIESIRMVD